jgi:hypothetical protein
MYLQADADDRDDLRGGDQAVHDVVHARDNGRILHKIHKKIISADVHISEFRERNWYWRPAQHSLQNKQHKSTHHGGHVLGEAVHDAAHRRGVEPTRRRVHHGVDQAVVQVLRVGKCVDEAGCVRNERNNREQLASQTKVHIEHKRQC